MIATIFQFQWWMQSVGPNIVASSICFAAGVIVGWKRYGPKVREHVRKVHEIHAHLKGDERP